MNIYILQLYSFDRITFSTRNKVEEERWQREAQERRKKREGEGRIGGEDGGG